MVMRRVSEIDLWGGELEVQRVKAQPECIIQYQSVSKKGLAEGKTGVGRVWAENRRW
jgi:hypothetical protein